MSRLAHMFEKCSKAPKPGSMNSLFSDFFREFWRGILGGVRDYLGEVLGDFYWKNEGKLRGKTQENDRGKKSENPKNRIK